MAGKKKQAGFSGGDAVRTGGRIDPAETVKHDDSADSPEGERPQFTAADDEEYRIWQTVSGNLRALIDASGHSQREFSTLTGIAPATLSGYLKYDPEHSKIPPVSYIVGLCRNKAFRRFHLDVGDFVTRKLSFSPASDRSAETAADTYIGCYYTYYYKYATAAPQATPDLMRKLRVGVLLVYDDPGSAQGLGVIAKFFDNEHHKEDARALKEAITPMIKDHTISDIKNRIRTASSESEFYTGSLTFTDKHFFITLECAALGDSALMIFNLPTKSPSKIYIGGLGCVNSVSRGSQRLPVSQRVIITRCDLDCPDTAIAKQLSVSAEMPRLRRESSSVMALLRAMRDPDSPYSSLDEEDRLVMVEDRLVNLIDQYLTRNHLSILSVSTDDNAAVYRFIINHLSPRDPVRRELLEAVGIPDDASAGSLGLPDAGKDGLSIYV